MAELFIRELGLDFIAPQIKSKFINGLRCQFEITKTSSSATNKSNISIFNLNEDSQSILRKDGCKVRLSVGYRGNQILKNQKTPLESIYIGDVIKVVSERSGPDIITKIELGDGQNKYRNAFYDKGYPPGITAAKIFQDISLAFDIPISSKSEIPNFTFSKGLTLNGLIREQLDYLTKKFNLKWSIQDNALQILKTDETIKESAIVLNKDSGLVGIPTTTKTGIEFHSLLQKGLNIGRAVKVESKYIDGVFKIEKVTHSGDNHYGTFTSHCEAKK